MTDPGGTALPAHLLPPEPGRPTLDEGPPVDNRRFGAFGGVFTPSILTILGVVMYLLFPRVVGEAGLGGALAVVVIAHLISIATGLSVSAIATNRTVGAGGAYFMISRSLGAPVGASIGIPLFLAQALSVTFYVVGFTQSLGYIIPNIGPTEAKLIGSGVLMALTLVTLKSTDLALKTQYVVMTAIGLSLISFFIGRGEKPPEEIVWFPSDSTMNFSEVFAIFFPAVTGIMAGVSMSGDLKDPRKALPKGTMAAILVGFVVYLLFPVWLAFNADLDMLRTNERAVWDISRIPFLIYVGVWGATLSSAVGSILSAPRTLQALAMDRLAPAFLAKGSGPQNEPRIGLAVTWVLAQGGILAGDLDAIAPVLTMFFLATYGVTNLASGLERWAASPSFRPTFRVPAIISILGAVACFYVMSIINMGAMLASMVICFIIYLVAQRRILRSTFGDARHGIWSALVRTALHRLKAAPYHAMNWRPNMVILGGHPEKRRYLLDLGSCVVQDRGIVSYFMLLRGAVQSQASERKAVQGRIEQAFQSRFPNVFFRVDVVDDVYRGGVQVAQSYGVGSFEANTVMLGWPRKVERADAYVQMLRDLTLLDRSLLLVRHDQDRGYGQRKHIHVWWGGMQANGGLMLLMAQLIRSHDAWRNARITTLTVVEDEQASGQASERLKAVFTSARVDAEARVILRKNRPITEIMGEESAEADVTLIGFRLPEAGADPEAFFHRYNGLLSALGTTVLVHSARDFDGTMVLFDDA